jgi:hypothetical protein
VLGQVTQDGGSAQARFTATATIAAGHVWRYHGQLQLVTQDRRWWVSWSPSDIHPALHAGQRFVLHAVWPPRAQVLAADNTVLSSRKAINQSGSLSLVTGNVVKATAAQAKALGARTRPATQIGEGGVEEAYQQQLAGRPALTIRVEGPGNRVAATVAHLPATPGKPVRTSIDMHVQLAASAAVRAATTTKHIDVVAIQPSTGRVLAVIERPGGFNRALQGVFPPGSTFKVVTASALSATGLRPASTVQCPAQVNIGGRTFHNFDNEHLGSTSLQTAFAVSCNSTFITLATQRLNGSKLASSAATFGFNSRPNLGIPATLGRFTHAENTDRPGGRRLRPGNRPGQSAQPGIHGGRRRRRHLAAAAARREPGAEAVRPAAEAQPCCPEHAAPDDAGGGHDGHRGQRRSPRRGLRQDRHGRVRFGPEATRPCVVHRLPRWTWPSRCWSRAAA